MNTKTNDILNDVIHTASQAILADDEAIKLQAMGDIIDALASVIPAEKCGRGILAAEGRACRPATAANDPQGFAKFLKAADGVQFVRFPGKEVTRLVASRRGTCGNTNTIFEIKVDHKDNFATVIRDGKVMFDIQGETIGHSIVESLAISCMHRYLRDQRMKQDQKKRRRARKSAERAGILTPEQELAETVNRQKEMN